MSRRGHISIKVRLQVLVELPADQIILIEHISRSIMSGKPETQAPFGHLNLPQRPVGVVRFSKAAVLNSITATAETQTDRRKCFRLETADRE